MNNIMMMSVNDIIPYDKNPRNNKEAVNKVAASLREFGFRQPIVVDRDMVIIAGHTRLAAAKKLKMKEVPVLVADDLSEEKVKAYRLTDNKTAEFSEWDDDLLSEELDSILDIDMEQFGFDLDLEGDEDEDDDVFEPHIRSAFTQNVFENQERMQFTADNYYGIPSMQSTQTVGDQMLRFCDWNEVDDPENYIAHFYYDDIKFMQAWRNPDKYVDKLRKFKAVVSPDFSLYTDFPRCLQILSCYRRQWVGAYWQSQGLDVIPDVVWGDKDSFAYCFEGLPKNSTVAVSTVGVKTDKSWNGKEGEMFRDGYDEMLKRLEPTTIIFYGDMIEGLEGNIIRCPSYYEQKRALLNTQKKAKDGKR